jgi:hypothetical protein
MSIFITDEKKLQKWELESDTFEPSLLLKNLKSETNTEENPHVVQAPQVGVQYVVDYLTYFKNATPSKTHLGFLYDLDLVKKILMTEYDLYKDLFEAPKSQKKQTLALIDKYRVAAIELQINCLLRKTEYLYLRINK